MLSRCCCCNGSFSLLLPAAVRSIPSHQSSRDEASRILNFRRGIAFAANQRNLKRGGGGGLCGGSSRWRRATSARPPPPPPPPNFGGDDSSGFQEEFSKIRDRIRIFFAVLFWMSLFFWASAWDGTDDSRNKKGPRFGKKFK